MSLRPRTLPSDVVQGLRVDAVINLEGSARSWLHTVKFGAWLRKSDADFLDRVADHGAKNILYPIDLVVPVPSHPIRSLLQVDLSLEWARCVASALDAPLSLSLLRHASWGQAALRKPQKLLTREARRAQLHAATVSNRFRSPPSSQSLRVLLVDDVLNTGCTLLEARSALEEAGHRVMGAFVLATTRF